MTSSRFFNTIFIIFIGSAQALTDLRESKYYTAGVVEFRPIMFGMTSADMLADHLRAYDDIIRSDEANLTDIIVFPEGTLNNLLQLTYVPAPQDSIIPCLQQADPNNDNNFAEFLIRLSCTARDVRKYVVINLTEKENCSTVSNDPRPCANNGLNVYNTNVVFDRQGRVISRYRKVHLYTEAKNTTYKPEHGIFDTDFGVRFGHFICFDILFYTPAQELVTRYGLSDLIFTSLFYSELPFLTGAQLQQSWAWGNNVNLLAAGASYPEAGMTGTGIYAGNTGHLVSAMIGGTGIRKLYVAKVPILKSASPTSRTSNSYSQNQLVTQKAQTGVKLMKDPQISVYKSELLDFRNESIIFRSLCYGEFCCNFHIVTSVTKNLENSEHYKYRIGVFDGNRTYEKEEWSDIKVCALYTCTNDDVDSCGEIFKDNINVAHYVVFESIELSGEFAKVDKLLLMPNSLNDQLYSLNSDSVLWNTTVKGSYIDVSYKLIAPNQNLMTFGIYAQYYERSSAEKKIDFLFSNLLILVAAHFFVLRSWRS